MNEDSGLINIFFQTVLCGWILLEDQGKETSRMKIYRNEKKESLIKIIQSSSTKEKKRSF